MNSGVTVESGDKFKQLIEKIATMVEDGGNKGIQFAEGIVTTSSTLENYILSNTTATSFESDRGYILRCTSLSFKPSFIIITDESDIPCVAATADNCIMLGSTTNYHHIKIPTTANFLNYINMEILDNGFVFAQQKPSHNYKYYAIGVGEEDTTLRDSLADILENKGVEVTEEDDMASLITKVEQKLDESSNYLLKNGGDPSIYTINYDYASGDATATHKTNYLQFSTSGSNYQSAFAFFTLKEEIDLTDKTMIMFDLEINGTTKYTYFAYGVYKGTLDNNTTFVKGNMQNDAIDYESKLYEKRAKYIIDVSDCTGVHKIGLRIGAYGFYSSTLNLYNIEIV
jgi:hypothetical protein